MRLNFATRPSALARWQTQWVIAALKNIHPDLDCAEHVIVTQGDRVLDRPLPEIGGKGVFTQELEAELLAGSMQAAVHSLKDLPVENPPGLTVGCIPARAEVRDALISREGYTLEGLPSGAVVGTSSLRRAAQVLAQRPDLTIRSLRGNVDTRIRKALEGQYDAILLAGAGLTRLGLEEHVTEWLPLEVILPAPGQGALGIQCRTDDAATLSRLAALDDLSTRAAVTAERQFLLGLGGGCALPVAALGESTLIGDQVMVELVGLVISPDGKQSIRVHGRGADPVALGLELAEEALARGARSILSFVASDQLK